MVHADEGSDGLSVGIPSTLRLKMSSLLCCSVSLRSTSWRLSSSRRVADRRTSDDWRLSYRFWHEFSGNLQIDSGVVGCAKAGTLHKTIVHSRNTLISETPSISGSHKSTLNWSRMYVFSPESAHWTRVGCVSKQKNISILNVRNSL